MKKLAKDELERILRLHAAWVRSSGTDGARADLSNTDLSRECLAGMNLARVNLSDANLTKADLRETNLQQAMLTRANLSGASLSRSVLKFADLTFASLERANLAWTDLSMANLRNAILDNAKMDTTTRLPFVPLTCPDTGSFIAWKGCLTDVGSGCIVKLQIPEDAMRSSSTGRKCRCSSAIVLEIQYLNGSILSKLHAVHSWYDPDFMYRIGETVSVADFDTNRFNECSTGIHFFITREEAVDYMLNI